jgi:hypothetical protein
LTTAQILIEERDRPDGPVWGPGRDDALAWLTLARLLGWSVALAGEHEPISAGIVIATGDPGARLGELRAAAEARPILVVAPPGSGEWARFAGAGRAGEAQQASGRLRWDGPGPAAAWTAAAPAALLPFEAAGAAIWSSVGGRACVAARTLPSGSVVATLGTGAAAVRKRLLTCGAPFPTAWLDLAACVIPRMDDPGASANVHLRSWSYAKLGEAEWARVGDALHARGARLSIGYTPGWVDDGDERRGAVTVAGDPVAPRRVAVLPSPLVRHTDVAGNAPGRVNDHEAEYRGLTRLVAGGTAAIELHGHTHLAADLEAWARADDRYDNVAWYRELDAGQPPAGGPEPGDAVRAGAAALRAHFAEEPTALVCPGQAWTGRALEAALAEGLRLVAADGLALRDRDRFCWCPDVPVAYLGAPEAAQLEGELPVMALFHDRELAEEGVGWLPAALDAWRAAGARRFIDLRELAAALELRLTLRARPWRLETGGDPSLPLPRPAPVLIHVPHGDWPGSIALARSGQARVQPLGDGLGRLVLPAPRG